MNPQDFANVALTHLPTVLSVLAALGLFKLLGKTVSGALKLWRGEVLKSPSKVDDALLLPIIDGFQSIANKLESGELPPAKAVQVINAFAAQQKRKLAAPVKPTPGAK